MFEKLYSCKAGMTEVPELGPIPEDEPTRFALYGKATAIMLIMAVVVMGGFWLLIGNEIANTNADSFVPAMLVLGGFVTLLAVGAQSWILTAPSEEQARYIQEARLLRDAERLGYEVKK